MNLNFLLLNLLVFYIGSIFGNIYYNLKNYIIEKKLKDEETKENKNKKTTKSKSVKTKKGKKEKECCDKGEFLANIPILSYFAFSKKCEKCNVNHAKLKFISEILIGIIFVLAFNSVGAYEIFGKAANVNNKMEMFLKGGFLFSFPLTLGFVYLLGAVEKKTHEIDVNIITYGLIVSAAILCLKFIVNIPEVNYMKKDIIIAGVYILIILAIYVMQLLTFSKDPESKYILDVVLFVFILTSFFGSQIMITTIVLSIIAIIIGYIFGIYTNYEYKENIIVKKEEGKLKTRTEGAYISAQKYIPYAKIIGWISIAVVIMNNYLALANVLI